MLTLRTLAVVFGSSLALLAAACGSTDGSEFDGGGGPNNGTDPNKDPNNGGNTSFTDGGVGEGGLGELQACATSSADGQLQPVNLVFIFDQSGSMGNDNNQNVKAVKWDPVVSGMTAFFQDPKSTGFSASLQYFPANQVGTPKANSPTCTPATYQAPAIAMTALPNNQFSANLASHNPGGGTPTLPALQGALAYAKQIAAQKPSEKSVVVLVTDGEPNDCSSSAANVSTEAAGSAAKIPTYVVGVGSSLSNLNQIAAAGGTKQAILVDVSNAQGTNAAFVSALNLIRGQTGTCSFALPAPPAGKTLDINAVNVVYTNGGKTETLSYNKDCTGGAGWHYDNAAAPANIQLCQTTCDEVKAASGGKVSIAFGCATKGGVK